MHNNRADIVPKESIRDNNKTVHAICNTMSFAIPPGTCKAVSLSSNPFTANPKLAYRNMREPRLDLGLKRSK
jgi:hypothetical protein